MSGENFKNPLTVTSGTAGMTVSNVQVLDRNNITFDITADDSGIALGGKSLTYATRDGADGSSVTVQNNVIMLAKPPEISAISGTSRTFFEIGAGAAESEHDDGHDFVVRGAEFYDLDQVEALLEGAATSFADIGLVDLNGEAVVAADHALRIRVGQFDRASATFTDDPDLSIVINGVNENVVSVTLSIAASKELRDSLDASADSLAVDLVVETFSGDLGDKDSLADNGIQRAGSSGEAAILLNALVIRRARPQTIEELIMLDPNTALPVAGDAASIAAAKAAGDAVSGDDFDFKQGDTHHLYLRMASAHANEKCLDTSTTLSQFASNTSPAGGQIHSDGAGGSLAFSTSGQALQALTLLSETECLIQVEARPDQPLGTYTFVCQTDSSEGATVATISFDIAAAEFVFETLDISLTSPEVMYAQSAPFAASAAGDGLPAGYQLSGGVETPVDEGSVAISAQPINNAGFSLLVDDIDVVDDDNVNFTLEHAQSQVPANMDFEQTLGMYRVTINVTDATGATQTKSIDDTLEIQHKFPPEIVAYGGQDSENVLREDSYNNNDWADDVIEVDMIKLRGDLLGSGQVGTAAAINGISSGVKGQQVAIKLCLNMGNAGYQDISTVWSHDLQTGALNQPDPSLLITEADALGTDKPMILITDVQAGSGVGAEQEYATDSDGQSQLVYTWAITARVVAEEAMEKTSYAPQGLDSGAGYGQRFAIAFQVQDASLDDGLSEWAYFDDVFTILPDNVEVTDQAHMLARASSESVGMAGDNFYPPTQGGNPGGGGVQFVINNANTVPGDFDQIELSADMSAGEVLLDVDLAYNYVLEGADSSVLGPFPATGIGQDGAGNLVIDHAGIGTALMLKPAGWTDDMVLRQE